MQTLFDAEQEKARIFGECGGKCGERPCIAWNEENKRKQEHRERRAEIEEAL